MKNKFYSFISLMALSFLWTGCAAVFTGTKDTLTFNSTPEGASVYIDGLEICKTPCSREVKRDINEVAAEFRLDGYETKIILLDREFNLVSIVNLGNLVGWGIDALTGAIMEYDKKTYQVELVEDKKTSFNNVRKVNIDTRKKSAEVYIMKQ